ncbi:putative ribosome biogenesis protein BMS1 TSR1 [Rosellinia necatrix]|uniref:Putative ribosome biogenesis protein BMS1 TSR1 n=1 Tax=Rosellinia necatrix TaxID=77044 RepID=A0A1S7UKN5_ROSNE|nr:putative ribosome biogenesis protein BMS1 TSR1 [Rosellinia necatrix]
MPSATHSHRPTTKVAHKSFKSRKSTKGSLRDQAKGKAPNERRKTPHQQIMSKLDRRNQAKQRQLIKHKEHQKEASIFLGRDGAPRIVAVVPLCADGDALAAIRSLNGSVDIEYDIPFSTSNFRVPVDRFKQKLQYIPVKRDLSMCMDAARVADYVLFVLSAETEVDALGELIIRSIENQGMSTLFTVVQGLDKVEPAKARPDVVKSLASFMTHFHPGQDKLYSLDARQECSSLMRSLCNTMPKGINWRDQRPWMLVENIRWPSTEVEPAVLTGVVRGKALQIDRLVHVGEWGTFQIEKITSAPLSSKRRKDDSMPLDDVEDENVLGVPGEDQDDLAELAPEEISMDDTGDGDAMMGSNEPVIKKGVLLDDHHYFSEDEPERYEAPKKVPRGTSAYQAKWILDDVSDSESEFELDEEMQDAQGVSMPAQPEDGIEGLAGREPTEAAMSEYPQSEAFAELNEDEDAQQLAAYRNRKHDEVEEDKEFPDEIELHPNVLARERLAKYRGLKSLRTSPWNKEEDRPYQPEEWARLLQISDYQSSRNRVLREALVGGVAPGTRVHVYLKGVPMNLQKSHYPSQPITLFGLLRHENKKTVVNFDIAHKDDYEHSIKAKEELIVQCGPRRFVINPLFSSGGSTENDVHKYCRFLHPGDALIATFMGPITWGSVPALFFKRIAPEQGAEGAALPLQLVATGTSRAPTTSRVIAKRAILTGHPYHIHKKVVTVRYMFFNREDVDWFKALPLWTRRGRSGYIKETLGTHGYFKANFDGGINPQDSVGVSLYKRMWPRSATPFVGPLLEEGAVPGQNDAMDEDI